MVRNVIDQGIFDDMLAKGKFTVIGLVCKGQFPRDATDANLLQSCVVVYVGGTAYKICL
jgi:hypothetical protein